MCVDFTHPTASQYTQVQYYSTTPSGPFSCRDLFFPALPSQPIRPVPPPHPPLPGSPTFPFSFLTLGIMSSPRILTVSAPDDRHTCRMEFNPYLPRPLAPQCSSISRYLPSHTNSTTAGLQPAPNTATRGSRSCSSSSDTAGPATRPGPQLLVARRVRPSHGLGCGHISWAKAPSACTWELDVHDAPVWNRSTSKGW